VPLAVIAAGGELLRRRKIEPPRSLLILAVLTAGVFFFFNLMLYHSQVWMPWLFGWRHGLPFILLIALSVPWLVARAGRFSGGIALVLLVSAAMSGRAVNAFIQAPDPALTVGEAELTAWLDSHPRPPGVIVTTAQILGSVSDAHFYWTYCDAPGEVIDAMVRQMPIDYLALYEREARCRFAMEMKPMRHVMTMGKAPRRVFVLEPLEQRR
jgi:hypothetical protein